jgi:hypothetical protein
MSGTAFEVTDAEVIVRPWEVTLTLPEPQGPLRWENPVPHRLMGLDCYVSRVRYLNRVTGFGIFFPESSTVISIDVLPGMGVNLVDAYMTTYRNNAATGEAAWQPLQREIMDDTVLLALVRMAGRISHED